MYEVIVLRLIHILGGIFWLGSSIFLTSFLVPALKATSGDVYTTVAALHRRRLFVWLPVASTLVVLTGLRLVWIDSAGFSAGYFSTASGRGFSIGGGAAILAFVLAVTVLRPTVDHMLAIGERLGTGAESDHAALLTDLSATQHRLDGAASANTWLLILAASAMAISRYI